MAKFRVNQLVQCTVNVWYVIEAESEAEAKSIVNFIDAPTCANWRDYEIVSDDKVLLTKIKEA
jgi:hypothetical protein